MSKTKTFTQYCNEPAFPESVAVCDDTAHTFRSLETGITRREYFTAKIAAAYISSFTSSYVMREDAAENASGYAEAVLKDMFVHWQESQIE